MLAAPFFDSLKKELYRQAACDYLRGMQENQNKTAMNLTENEITALKACLNYSDRESQLSDNMSNGGTAEFKAELGWNSQQVGGLISSLIEKGLGYPDEDGVNGNDVDIFWLTEKGVNAIFDVIEADGAEPSE